MQWIESLYQADLALLQALNSGITPGWREVWLHVAERTLWIPLYAIIAVLLVQRYRRQVAWALGFVIACAICADVLSTYVLKPWIGRLRPCCDPLIVPLLTGAEGLCKSLYSMPSNHAANTSAFALSAALLLPKHRSWLVPVLTVYVLANGFSRPILGMHYPSDVLAGWGLGAGLVAFAWLIVQLNLRFHSNTKASS
jgi:undecaprenyl-diphosphatase